MSALAWIALAGLIIQTASMAYSYYSQGQAEKQAAEYNARMAEYQAKAAERQAKWAEYNAALAKQEAERKAKKKELEKERLLGMQRARYGKSGVQLEGTPLLVMEETNKLLEQDIADILYGGELEAYNYRMQAQGYRTNAGMYQAEAGFERYKGRAKAGAGTFLAGTTLLTGAAKATRLYMEDRIETRTRRRTQGKELLEG